MSPEEKSIQYGDLNANERLLEIQAEIVAIEKRRIYENSSLTEEEKNEMREKIKFLVSEEKMILETRYAQQKGMNGNENTEIEEISKSESGEIKEILKQEIAEDEKIEDELKEIIKSTQNRMWYEKWWGKLIIIFIGALILGVLRVDNAFLNNFIN